MAACSTGSTASTIRDAGFEVTDVAAVTGVAEMLDGRVKTLHPSIHGGLLADLRLEDHDLPPGTRAHHRGGQTVRARAHHDDVRAHDPGGAHPKTARP